MSSADPLSRAIELLREGQALEARPSPEALKAAVQLYEQALVLLRTLPISETAVRHQLALTAMNRANAFQRQNTVESVAAAIAAYDEAIAFFRTLPLAQHPDLRNSLGAAWMNRGHAFYLRADPASLVEAVRCQNEALAMLGSLPLDAHPSFRINFVASRANLANALLGLGEDDSALAAARETLALVAPGEQDELALADVGLKGRRAACEAIGRLLARVTQQGASTDPLADEASDLVDSGLALARHWETRGFPHFRPLAVRLYRFGAQLYRIHLPDFLAEFLLEQIDPDRCAGATPEIEELHRIASEALSAVRIDLETRHPIFIDTPATSRLLERLQSVREAETRLRELRARFPATS